MHFSFVFNNLDTYEESLHKLTQAQDTSNLDDTDGKNDTDHLREQKKSRRMKAKKKESSSSSSSSSSEDICLKNKENKIKIIQNKVLPPFPDRGNFVSTDKVIDKPIQNITNILHEKDINSINSNGEL